MGLFFWEPGNKTGVLEEKQGMLSIILKDLTGNYENLAFYDKDGNAITSDGRFMNFKDRDYFKIPMSGKEYISDPAFSAVVNKVLQYYAVPVYDFNNSPVGASAQSSAAFEDVSTRIENTDELVRQIRLAMREQKQGSMQINSALSEMNNSTSEVRSASSEMADGNKSILAEVAMLQDATLAIKNSIEEMAIGADKINSTGSALSDITGNIEQSIAEIGTQVDQFKV